ncbi:MAG TPA: SCO family protein, partial [Polyangia bacterium]|nr:SCO family protein [Polyangia bacterium]
APVPLAEPATQALWPVPAFSYVDQDGQPLTRQQLLGHVWIADFIYTQCRSACPLLTARMVMLQRQLARYDVRFVSFSVDPAHDTPAALKDYAHKWHGDESRWRLLATTPAALPATAVGMHVMVAATTDANDPIVHSDRFLLVDAAGIVRGAYDSGDADELARLVADATKLPGVAAIAAAVDHVPTSGTALYDALGCAGCHARPDVAPSLAGVFGSTVALADGRHVRADDAYIRASIVAPADAVVAGYTANMPSYAGHVTDAQLAALVAFVHAMPPSGAPAASRQVVVDPVCKMSVSVGESDLHVDRDGKRYYFCSAACRDKFTANPAKYTR